VASGCSFVQQVYRHADGTPAGSVENVRVALCALFEFAAGVDAKQFRPRMLAGIRDELASARRARAERNLRGAA